MKNVFISFLALYQGSSAQNAVGAPPQLVPPGGATIEQPLPVTKIPPPGQLFGAFGQLCPAPAPTAPTKCSQATDKATDAGTGMLLCEAPYDCCLCESIECGTVDVPCQELSIGTAGAFGVKSINVVGTPTNGGAGIECGGADACKHAKMTGSAVSAVDCGSPDSCKDAIITLTDPAPYFALECSAAGSCEGAFVGVNFPAPAAGTACPAGKKEVINLGGIQCSTAGSCTDLTFGVANSGCAKVVIDVIECLAPGACTNAVFNFIGDVDVRRCELGTTGQTGVLGLEKCFTTTTLAPATTAPPLTTTPPLPPLPPQTTAAAVPDVPATTAAPGTGPQSTTAAPGTTNNMVWMVNANLENLNCQDARSCQGGKATVTDPSNYLVFQCAGIESCEGADLTFSLTPSAASPVTNIDGLILRGDRSGKDMTIRIDNQQGTDTTGQSIITSLDRILCEGRQSCVNMHFLVGYNVAVGQIVCARGACTGCTVQIDASSPKYPCDPDPLPTTMPPTLATTLPPPAPATTVPAVPATTVPAVPATTNPPVNTLVPIDPVTTAAPGTPTTPATTSAAVTTTAPVNPGNPGITTIAPSNPTLVPRVETFTNMPNGWSLECAAAKSCENGIFDVHLDGGSRNPIRRYDGFVFLGEHSGRGATVQIQNTQVGQRGNVILTIDEIACEGAGSCIGASFVVGYNVAIQTITCAPGACYGCTIKIDATSPPFPCDSTQITTAAPVATTAAPEVTTSPVVPAPGTTSAPAPVVTTAVPAPVPATTASGVTPGGPRVETFTNMANGWFLNCNRDSSCKDGVFTVNIDNTVPQPVTRYDGFLFTGPYSGFGATVKINNQQSNTVLNIGQLACEGANSCDGLTFILGYNVAVQRLKCTPGACDRCFVKITESSEPIPCDPSANNAPLTTEPPVMITTAAPPAGMTTAAPVDPVTTSATATTAAPPAPEVPLVGVAELTCSARGDCANMIQKVVNPMNNFYIFCGDGACTGAQFTIDLNGNAASPITRLDGYLFEGVRAAAGAVVTVNNQQSGRTVANIAKITCRGLNACADTQFYTGYFVSIGGVECSAGACAGCTIDIAGTKYPCDPSQSGNPQPPVPMTTAAPVNPVTTSATPANPVEPVPVPVNPVPVVTAPPPVTLEGARDLSCHHGTNSCQNGHYSVMNPANGFLLYCGAANSCQDATFNIDLLDGSTNRINGLMFQEVASAAGASITINNNNPFVITEIERISCGAQDACAGTTIDVGYGVSISRLDCEPGACMGCTVIVGREHYPCDPLQV